MQTSVTVSTSINFGTHYRATRAAMTRGRSAFMYGFFLGFPLVCLAIVMARGQDLNHPALLGLPTWFTLLLGPLFVLLFLPLLQAMNVWQRRRKNAVIRGVLRFTVGPEGFEARGETFETKVRWNAIHQVVETKEFIFLYVAAGVAQFIPKACVPSPSEMEAIRGIIREAVGEKAKLLVG